MDEHASKIAQYVAARKACETAEQEMHDACQPILERLIAADDWKGAYAFVRFVMPSSVTKALFCDAIEQKWPGLAERIKQAAGA